MILVHRVEIESELIYMWQVIVNERVKCVEIRRKIDEVFDVLVNRMKDVKNFDLYLGRSGICLFFAYYSNISKRANSELEDCIDGIIDTMSHYTIENVKELTFFAESFWLLCHLYEMKKIDMNIDNYFLNSDRQLYMGMEMLLREKEYGCINGGISIAMYFYYRYILGDYKSKLYLDRFVDILKDISIEHDNTIRWICTVDYGTYEQGYNLGIAHGIPGILLFLRKLYLKNIKVDEIEMLLLKSCNFMLQQKHSLETHKSYFYNVSNLSGIGHDTRLGWCYGDMSVGYALYLISLIQLSNYKDIRKEAEEILIETTKRTNLLDIGIVDAGICHGTSSIAHMYHRLYSLTSKLEFRNSAQYWYDETLKMVKSENEYAGYKLPYYLKDSEKDIRELHNLSFLTGISGIGLSLISAIYPIEPTWDMSLLLS